MFLFWQAVAPTVTIHVTNPSNVVNFFDAHSAGWIPQMAGYVNKLFLLLAGIELAVLAGKKAMEREGPDVILAWVAWQVLVRGFFYMLIIEAPTWLFSIIDSFTQIGKTVGTVAQATPSGLVADGLSIFAKLMAQALWKGVGADPIAAISYLLAAIAIAIAFAIVAIHLVKFQVETFLAIRAAFIFVGFGGSTWTSSYTERYITLVIAAGVRLMVLLLIVGFGHAFAVNWWGTMIDSSTYGPTGVTHAIDVAMEAFIWASICWGTPQFVAGMLSGAPSLSAQSAIGFGAPIAQALIAGATMAATGGASVIAAAGGAATGGAAGGAAGSAASGMASRAMGFAKNVASSFSQPSAPSSPSSGGAPYQPPAPRPNEV